jgi:hypothetical protein
MGGHQLSEPTLLQLHSACSLHEQSQGSSFKRREDSRGVTSHPAQLVLDLGLEPVGGHVSEKFLLLPRLHPGIRATLGPVPQPRDVAEYFGVCSFVAKLLAGEVLPLAWLARSRRWEMTPISPQ